MYTEEINKIALNYTDDKRLQTFDGITTGPYGSNAFKVCESEMLTKKKAILIKLYYNKISRHSIKQIYTLRLWGE